MKIWSLKSENAAKTFRLRFSLNLLVTLMVSYHLNFHDVTLAGLPVLLILHRLESSKITPGSRYAGIFGAVLALALVPLYAMGRGASISICSSGCCSSLRCVSLPRSANLRRSRQNLAGLQVTLAGCRGSRLVNAV